MWNPWKMRNGELIKFVRNELIKRRWKLTTDCYTESGWRRRVLEVVKAAVHIVEGRIERGLKKGSLVVEIHGEHRSGRHWTRREDWSDVREPKEESRREQVPRNKKNVERNEEERRGMGDLLGRRRYLFELVQHEALCPVPFRRRIDFRFGILSPPIIKIRIPKLILLF